MLKRLESKHGATLVEVMASMALFTVAIVAILGVVSSNRLMANRADYAYIAYNLAKNHIETLRAMNFSDLSGAAETATALDETGASDLNGDFTRTTTVTTPYSSDSNLAQITVDVSYNVQGLESADPMEISSVIYNNG